MTGHEELVRHVVVLDCNIYLDVARLVGAPFSWEGFYAAAAKLAKVPVPHPMDRAYDSLRAIATCTSGRFAPDEVLEVWTSTSIDKIVGGKAKQSTTPDPQSGYHGLGWSHEDAQALVDDLVGGLLLKSGGGSAGDPYPDGNPPLDHEDGKVFGTCRWLSSEDPLAKVYCITRDRGFLEASRAGRIRDHTRVLTPTQFVELNRAVRNQRSFGLMPKPKLR